LAHAGPDIGGSRTKVGWNRIRLSVVVPIGVIVAVAIVCVVVAVLSSARRADEVALDIERQLFTRALSNHGQQVLREVESVATSEAAVRRIRTQFDPEWVQIYVGSRLQSFFEHDFVFVADGRDRFLYASFGHRSHDPNWFNSIRPDIKPVLDLVRSQRVLGDQAPGSVTHRAVQLQGFLNRPAIVAGVAVAPDETLGTSDADAPIILSVKFIDEDVLADIASRLQLSNLRKIDGETVPAGDYVFTLGDPQGRPIAQFAWTPKQPGAAIVHSVIPFIALALAGFAVLAGLVLAHMRRTAATIAAGETRLRHLALHDPLCGLPNRIFFGERLDREGPAGRTDRRGILHRSRSFQGRQRHTRPSGRRRAHPRRHPAAIAHLARRRPGRQAGRR
jgi:sensor domain CHASE-containing protein